MNKDQETPEMMRERLQPLPYTKDLSMEQLTLRSTDVILYTSIIPIKPIE
ncbi:hypothetical protein [Paenibacillus sp. ACRRY]|nr:hypothetical protein [Paenibacillus sp. ACRRY]